MVILLQAGEALSALPREIVLLLFAGYCVYLVKNWGNLSSKILFSESSAKESIVWGLILYLFSLVTLVLGGGQLNENWAESLGVVSLGFGFSFILIRSFIPFFIKKEKDTEPTLANYLEFLAIFGVIIFISISLLMFFGFPGVTYLYLPIILLFSLIVLKVFVRFIEISTSSDFQNVLILIFFVVLLELLLVPFIINALV